MTNKMDNLEAWTDLVAQLVHLMADSADRQAELQHRLDAIEERFEHAIASTRQHENQGREKWPERFTPPPEVVRVEE